MTQTFSIILVSYKVFLYFYILTTLNSTEMYFDQQLFKPEHPDCSQCKHNGLVMFGLTADNVRELSENIRQISYKRGETIFKQGAFVSHIIFLRSGLLKLFVESANHKDHIVRFIPSENFVGFPALEGENSYPFTAVCLKDSSVCLIHKQFVEQLMLRNPQVGKNVNKWYAHNQKFIYNKMAALGTKSIHGRFADTLMYLSQSEFLKEDIFSWLTRKDMADFAGISLESATKLLNELKNDKLIAINGKAIEITDWEMLQRLSRLS